MRWEAGYYILWTQRGVLTKEERKQVKEEQAAMAKECSGIGDAQKFFLRSEVMAAHHAGFVSRIVSSLKGHDVAATELSAHDALIVAREAMYRETVGSSWRPILVGDRFMRGGRKRMERVRSRKACCGRRSAIISFTLMR